MHTRMEPSQRHVYAQHVERVLYADRAATHRLALAHAGLHHRVQRAALRGRDELREGEGEGEGEGAGDNGETERKGEGE